MLLKDENIGHGHSHMIRHPPNLSNDWKLTLPFRLLLQRPYQCHECGKRFQTNSLLTAHKKYHDSTTYPCKICGREFNMPSSLRRHVQTHRKDKAFQCTICLQSFNTRVYLTRHMFKHSAKNYQCTFCKEKFNTAIGKRHHERMKHSYEPELS